MYKSEMTIKVPFYDNDPMGIVWHGNYVKYIEQARCKMLDEIGYNYIDMKADGISYPVAKLSMKYIKPATFNQYLKIITTIETIEPSLNIKYEIRDMESNDKIFVANSMQICVNIDDMTSIYVAPKNLKEKLNV